MIKPFKLCTKFSKLTYKIIDIVSPSYNLLSRVSFPTRQLFLMASSVSSALDFVYQGTRSVLQEKVSVKETKITLNNGVEMPILGLGTYLIKDSDKIKSSLNYALKAGYRQIDTATVYHNENHIGQALVNLLQKYHLKREDIFITSKLAPQDQGKTRTRPAVVKSLVELGVDYIDLYLIHWPGAGNVKTGSEENQILRRESWEELITLQQEGKLKAIGVSNYTAKHLRQLLQHSQVPPAVNQVEFHPFYRYPDEFYTVCAEKNILLQAYCSFGGSGERSLLDHPVIKKIGEASNHQPSQILLRWALQSGYAVIPKSVNESRINQNAELDFILDPKQMELINSIKERTKFSWDPEAIF